MSENTASSCIAFEGLALIGRGAPAELAPRVKDVVDNPDHGPVLIFDAATSRPIEWDLRGTKDEVAARFAPVEVSRDVEPEPETPTRRGPGRPKLGVVSREVTLLPRHWAWLAEQPGSASVTLRKLVDHARQENAERDRVRRARDASYGFLTAIAGNLPAFEEVCRALFGGDGTSFRRLVAGWPAGIRDHALRLADGAFEADAS